MVTTGAGSVRNKPRSKSFRTNRRNLQKPRVRVTNEHRALVRKEICEFLVRRHGYEYEKREGKNESYLFVYKPGCTSRLRGIAGLLSHLRRNRDLLSDLEKNSEFFSDVLLDFELRQQKALSSMEGGKKRARQEETDHRCCKSFAHDDEEMCTAASMDEASPLECSVGIVCNGFVHPRCYGLSEKQIEDAMKSTDWICPLCTRLEDTQQYSSSSSSSSGGEDKLCEEDEVVVSSLSSKKHDHEMHLAALSVLELATPRSRAGSMLSPRTAFGTTIRSFTDDRMPSAQISSMPQVVAVANFAWLAAGALNLNEHSISLGSLERGFLNPETEKNGTLDLIMTRLVVKSRSRRRFAEVEMGLNASMPYMWWDERLVKIVNSWSKQAMLAKKDLQSRVSRRSTGRPLLRRAVAAALAAGNTTRVAKLFGIPARTLRRHVAKEREILQLPKPSARTRTLSRSVVAAAVASAGLKEQKQHDDNEEDEEEAEDLIKQQEQNSTENIKKKSKKHIFEKKMSPELTSYRRSLRALSVKDLRREVKFWDTQMAILEGKDSSWWLRQQSDHIDAASILGLWTQDAALGARDFPDILNKEITSFGDLTVRGRVKIVWALIHFVLHRSIEIASAFGRQHSVLSSASRGVSFGHDDEGRSMWNFPHFRDGHVRVYAIAAANPYGWTTLCHNEKSLKDLASRLSRGLATSPSGGGMLMVSPRVTSNQFRSIGVKALNALVQGLDAAEDRARKRQESGATRKSFQEDHLILRAAQEHVAKQLAQIDSGDSNMRDSNMITAVHQVMAMELAKFLPTPVTSPMVSPVRSVTSDSTSVGEITPQQQNQEQQQERLSVRIPSSSLVVVDDEGLETPATSTARFLSKLSIPSTTTTTTTSTTTTTTVKDLQKLIEQDEKMLEKEYHQRGSSSSSNSSRNVSRTCTVCRLEIGTDSLICCSRSRCGHSYHMECLTPALTERPSGRWNCPTCVATSSSKSTSKKKSTNKAKGRHTRRRRCGRCAGCLRPQCGQCRNCLDKPCFGGKGTLKQACKLRVCEQMKPANPTRRKKRIKKVEDSKMEVEDSKTTGDDAIEKKEKDIEVLEAVDKETKNVLSEKETISASDAHGSMSSSLVMS